MLRDHKRGEMLQPGVHALNNYLMVSVNLFIISVWYAANLIPLENLKKLGS
jgi:hypothetical protein